MSSRPSRKRKTTQHFSPEDSGVKVKDEPNREKEETPVRRQNGRTARRGGSLPATVSQTQHVHDDGDIDVEDTRSNPFMAAGITMPNMKIFDIVPGPRQLQKWDRLSETEKSQIVKAVTRLLLMKGNILFHSCDISSSLDLLNLCLAFECRVYQ